MMGKGNSPKSPDEGETHDDLFLDCHLEPAGQPDHNGQDNNFGCTVDNGDHQPPLLRGSLALVSFQRGRRTTLTTPLQAASSGNDHMCSGPRLTETANAATTPQRVNTATQVLHMSIAREWLDLRKILLRNKIVDTFAAANVRRYSTMLACSVWKRQHRT